MLFRTWDRTNMQRQRRRRLTRKYVCVRRHNRHSHTHTHTTTHTEAAAASTAVMRFAERLRRSSSSSASSSIRENGHGATEVRNTAHGTFKCAPTVLLVMLLRRDIDAVRCVRSAHRHDVEERTGGRTENIGARALRSTVSVCMYVCVVGVLLDSAVCMLR